MKIRPALTLLFVLVLGVAAGGRAAAAIPPAPTPLAPAFGANVLVPFTISWSAVSDPSGIEIGRASCRERVWRWSPTDILQRCCGRRHSATHSTTPTHSRTHPTTPFYTCTHIYPAY